MLFRNQVARFFKNYRVAAGLLLIPGALAMAIALRLLVLSIFNIPSDSMVGTLWVGDRILVSKLHYGPRLPASPFEVPWLNVLFYLSSDANEKVDLEWWKPCRLKGLGSVQQGDVVVFNLPGDKKNTYIKRCIGLPGDTLKIVKSEVSVNESLMNEATTVMDYYKVWVSDTLQFQHLLNTLKVTGKTTQSVNERPYVEIHVEKSLLKDIQSSACIDSVRPKLLPPAICYGLFPGENAYQWSVDDFGPVIIPKKGMMIALTPDNLLRYGTVLEQSEKVHLEKRGDQYWDDGKPIKEYIFTKDYYFMMGDNRHNSCDSRYWGFVPEDYIVGKAVMVLCSNNPESVWWKSIRWSRIGKLIH
jgi:signal peptidase I